MTRAIGAIAARGLVWAVVQNWGGRAITFGMFAVLARLLSPTDYGVASAAILVITFVGLLSEFGFGEAIIQRRGLDPWDLNLPFVVSVATSLVLSLVIFLLAGPLETWLNAPGLTPVLIALCGIPALTTVTAFQEASFKRKLAFKKLAIRVLAANLIGGVVAIVCASQGAGVWSLVAQVYVVTLVSLVWLWCPPAWVPTRDFRTVHFVALTRFSVSVVTMRVVDFSVTRFVDIIIITKYGIVAFGIYAVGAKLYQILLQLLQGVLNDVSLPVLSLIADDKKRMGEIYFRSVTLAAYTTMPVFVLCSALAPEICSVLFGAKWTGASAVAQPLLLVGAVQSVQYLNGPYITARGKPAKTMSVTLMRNALIGAGLLLIPTGDVTQITIVFCVLQLLSAPISFAVLARELALGPGGFVRILAPAISGCTLAFCAVVAARPWISSVLDHDLPAGVALGAVFALCLVVFDLLFARGQVVTIFEFFAKRLSKEASYAA